MALIGVNYDVGTGYFTKRVTMAMSTLARPSFINWSLIDDFVAMILTRSQILMAF